MSNSAGIFQVDELLKRQLKNSSIAPYVEVMARVAGKGAERGAERLSFKRKCRPGYEVEFVTLDGETVAVVSLSAAQLRPIGRREIAHAGVLA